MVEQLFQWTDLFQKTARPHGPDPRGSRDIVGCVSDEGEEVDDLVRRYTQALGGVRFIDPFSSHASWATSPRVQKVDPRPDELVEILIPGNHDRLDPGRLGLEGEGTDHVVSLITFQLNHLVVERFDEFPDPRKRLPQLVGHLFPRCLVIRVLLLSVAEPGIEDHSEIVRLVLIPDREQEVDEAPRRRRVFTPGVRQRSVNKGEERSVDERVGVDQEKPWGRGGSVDHGESSGRVLNDKGATPELG